MLENTLRHQEMKVKMVVGVGPQLSLTSLGSQVGKSLRKPMAITNHCTLTCFRYMFKCASVRVIVRLFPGVYAFHEREFLPYQPFIFTDVYCYKLRILLDDHVRPVYGMFRASSVNLESC